MMRLHWNHGLAQNPCEPVWKYLERFNKYTERWPMRLHCQSTRIFIDNLIPHERRALDYMAGGDVLNCTNREVWDLIYERLDFTKYIDDVMGVYQDPNIAQAPYEPTWEYLERFLYYMEGCTSRHIWKDIAVFLDNITTEERCELDYMAGGSVMNCTPNELWSLIHERAENTRSYIEYSLEQPCVEENSLLAQEIYEFQCEINESLETPSPLLPEPSESSLDDIEVTVEIDEHENEIMVEKDLHLEPACTEDIPTEDLISLVCSDMIIRQNIVRTCIFTFPPITNLFLSSLLQDHLIKEAVPKDKVWCSYKEVESYIPLAKACKQVSSSDKFFDKLRINWKSRKKSRRKILNKGESMFCVPKFRINPIFIWKPGWDPWRKVARRAMKKLRNSMQKIDGAHPWDPWIGVSHTPMKKIKRYVRKFDGTHPWDPNI